MTPKCMEYAQIQTKPLFLAKNQRNGMTLDQKSSGSTPDGAAKSWMMVEGRCLMGEENLYWRVRLVA